MADPLVSVVIPTFQQKERTFLVLYSLINQGLAKDEYEVIVVDDGSTDGTPELFQAVEERTLRWHYLRQPVNMGMCAARNRGAEVAIGEYLLFLDGDCVACPNTLRAHLLYHRDKGNAVGVGAPNVLAEMVHFRDPQHLTPYGSLSPELLTRLQADPDSLRITPELVKCSFGEVARRSIHGHHYPPVEGRRNQFALQTMACVSQEGWHEFQWLALYTNHFSMKREAFSMLGGFDHRMHAVEGMDLGVRCTQQGIPIKLVPGAEHCHIHHPHRFDLRLQQMLEAFRWMYERHRTTDVALGALWTLCVATDMYVPDELGIWSMDRLLAFREDREKERQLLHVFGVIVGLENEIFEMTKGLPVPKGRSSNSSQSRMGESTVG